MSMLWVTVTVLLVLGSCNWTPAGGQTCPLSAAQFTLATVIVSAESVNGSTPGARVTWRTTVPPECVTSYRVEFRTSIRGPAVVNYTTTDTSQTEVIQTGLQPNTIYYVTVLIVAGESSEGTFPTLMSRQVQILSGVVAVLRMMQLHFINGTPKVEGNSARVELVVDESTASLLCELLTKEKLDLPMVANCSNGSATFTGIAPGKYRLRVVASAPGYIQTALRRRVVIPEGPEDCTANLIDEGVVIDGSNVTVYFQGVGPVKEYLCIVDRQRRFPCNSPISIRGFSEGKHHFKIIPLGCGRRYTALPFTFTI